MTKRTLDVYRDAAREYRGGPSGEGLAILVLLVIAAGVWAACHFFGWCIV